PLRGMPAGAAPGPRPAGRAAAADGARPAPPGHAGTPKFPGSLYETPSGGSYSPEPTLRGRSDGRCTTWAGSALRPPAGAPGAGGGPQRRSAPGAFPLETRRGGLLRADAADTR